MARLSEEHFRAQTPKTPKANRLSRLFKSSDRKSISPIPESSDTQSPSSKASPTTHGRLRKGFQKVGLFPSDRIVSSSSEMDHQDTARSGVDKQELEFKETSAPHSPLTSLVAAATMSTDTGGRADAHVTEPKASDKGTAAEMEAGEADGDVTAIYLGGPGPVIKSNTKAATHHHIRHTSQSNWTPPESWSISPRSKRESSLTHIPIAAVALPPFPHHDKTELVGHTIGERDSHDDDDGSPIAEPGSKDVEQSFDTPKSEDAKVSNLQSESVEHVISEDSVESPKDDTVKIAVPEETKSKVEHPIDRKDTKEVTPVADELVCIALQQLFKNGPNVLKFGNLFSISNATTVAYIWKGLVLLYLADIIIAALQGPMYFINHLWLMGTSALMYQLVLSLGVLFNVNVQFALLDPLLYTFPRLLKAGLVAIGYAVGYATELFSDGFLAGREDLE